MPNIKHEVRWITPDLAKHYLENQVPNRAISWSKVRSYARDMVDGAWRDNGESGKINPEGKMLDGQHRMQAIILAARMAEEEGKKFEGLHIDFALNVPNEARQTMDIGKKRSLGDEMSFEGAGHAANRTAAIVSWHLSYLRGNYINSSGNTVRIKPTQAESLEHWRENKALFHTTTERATDTSRAGLGPSGPLGVAYHVLRTQYGDDLTETFWTGLITGANLSPGSPILALRNKLMGGRFDPHQRHTILAYIFRAWNLWIDGKTVDTIYFKAEIVNKNFPVPRDPAKKRNPVIVDGSVLTEEDD